MVEYGTICWLWMGHIHDGYGRIGGKAAHRVVYTIVKDDIPKGLQLDHLCRNRRCVNPDHLEPVTQRENILRGEGIAAINKRKTHCKNGHEFTPENTYIRGSRNGNRECMICRNISVQKSKKRKKELIYG